MQRVFKYAAALVFLFATEVSGQVQVEVHLEQARYLAGEPIVIVIDVLSVGDEPVAYRGIDWRVKFTVIGVERRVLPDAFGCFMGGLGSGIGGGVDHPPSLAPGERRSSRHLLKEYDLGPGEYRMAATGKADVSFAPGRPYIPNPPPPPSRHKPTDPFRARNSIKFFRSTSSPPAVRTVSRGSSRRSPRSAQKTDRRSHLDADRGWPKGTDRHTSPRRAGKLAPQDWHR